MSRKIILFELNEVPFRILEEYCRWRPLSRFATLMPNCTKYETVTEDQGSLSPWMTWPSLHRGVNNEKHGIHDFGQDLREIDEAYPSLWTILASHGAKVGICGSLHSYPLPANPENYAFYLPDTFAAGSECFPEKLSVFQEFNLTMARASGRNVSTKVPWKAAVDLLAAAPGLGLKAATFGDIGRQLIEERLIPERKSRRRTYQSVLAFDVFMKLLKETRPDFTTFFTNHVASAMHRFWAAAFPGDYEVFGYDDGWVRTFGSEIRFAMEKADRFLGGMADFVEANPEYVLWITSSMGQSATTAEPVNTQLYVTRPERLMESLGAGPSDWKPMPAMLPQFNVRVDMSCAGRFRDALSGLAVDGARVKFRETEEGFFSLDFGHINLDMARQKLTYRGDPAPYEGFGLANVAIEDLTGSNAYHIPEGCLLIYDPRDRSPKPHRTTISTLEIAPAILRNYSVPPKSYMRKAPAFEGSFA